MLLSTPDPIMHQRKVGYMLGPDNGRKGGEKKRGGNASIGSQKKKLLRKKKKGGLETDGKMGSTERGGGKRVARLPGTLIKLLKKGRSQASNLGNVTLRRKKEKTIF